MMNAVFGFKRQPFDKDIKTDRMFETYDMKEANTRLSFILQHRGILLLSGEPGAGKTSVLRRFVFSLNPQTHVHHYTPHATVSQTELYRQLNALFNLQPRNSKAAMFSQIQQAITDLYEHQGKIPVIALDEVHLMENLTIQELILLTNFEMDSKTPFILILVGQPALKEKLKLRIHEPLTQRIAFKYHMAGLKPEETKPYVVHHLKLAGRKDPLFEESAFDVLHQLGQGLPRKIGNLCNAAMMLAMVKGASSINADLVLEASPCQ